MSLKNQTIDPDLFEVILVKNFKDESIEKFLEDSGFRSINANDGPIGLYMSIGVNEAKGEIIVFLDDDDLFSDNKLERIYSIYSELKFDYYRNEIITFNDLSRIKNSGIIINGPVIIREDIPVKRKLKLIRKTLCSISSSSTVVSKQFLIKWLFDAKEIRIAFDSYLYYLALFDKEHEGPGTFDK